MASDVAAIAVSLANNFAIALNCLTFSPRSFAVAAAWRSARPALTRVAMSASLN